MTSAPTPEPTARKAISHVTSLDSLVGAHPHALRKMYGAARPADPKDLGETPRGLMLTLEAGADVFLALRPFVRAVATGAMPWQGKTFDHGGNSGQNVVLGRRVARFRAEVGASLLDARPALVLRYDAPDHANPWPLRNVIDELRSVGPGVAIGPVLASFGGAPKVVLWFGLEARRG